jgi:type II secretory pathway component GspD/PulD (secretin)
MGLALLQPGAQFKKTLATVLLASLCLLVTGQPAHAAGQPAWFSEPYPYVLVEQDLRKAMDEFGQHLNLTLVFSDKVRGKSQGVVRGRQAGDFLQNLCDANGLAWYVDGTTLYLTADDETVSQLFTARDTPLADVRRYLDALPVYGERLSVQGDAAGKELRVSGPPAYLARLQHYLNQPRPPAMAPHGPGPGVRVYRGTAVSEEHPF